MKYIIEIPDDVQYVLLSGKADNKYYTAVRPIAELEELNSDYINEHFGSLQDEAYHKGFEDGKNSIDMGCEGCRYSLRFAKDEPCKSCSNCYKSKYESMPKEDDRIEVGDELNSDYINEHYGELQETAYKKGLHDGESKCRYCNEYQRGLEDAWEAARRIVVDTDHGGLALGTLSGIFGTQSYSYIMRENTVQEAIDKIKAYEDKHSDRIEVGDEVTFLPNDRRGIVTACHVPDVYAENDKYAVFCGTTVEYVLRQHITKTGKHYDIASILEAMRK